MKRNVWTKAAASNNGGGGCVEVMITNDTVKVRDTKANGTGPELVFTHSEWAAFVDGMSKNEFSL
jgi:Domain of unknown function (DUF397)